MQCGNCGQQNGEKEKTCRHCGANLAMAEYFHPPKRPQKAEPTPQRKAPRPKSPAPKPPPPVRKPVTQAAPRKKRRSPFMLLLFLFLLVCAAGIFFGRMFYFTGTERYEQAAEGFVQAVVMADEEALAQYIHPDMYGKLRPRSYGAVERCVAEAQSCEELATQPIDGIEQDIRQLYRVRVRYDVYIAGQAYPCSMDVYVANIGGEVYAVKTEAIEDSSLPPIIQSPKN